MRTHGRSLAAPPLCTIFLLLVNVFTVAHSLDVDSSVEENIDYLDNDLAKGSIYYEFRRNYGLGKF